MGSESVRLMRLAAALVVMSGVMSGCGVVVREIRKDTTGMVSPPPSDLTRARMAWSYFERGPAPAEVVTGAGFSTPRSLGDDVAATIAAYRTGVIPYEAFRGRIDRLLRFMEDAPLSDAILPGRFYNARGQLMDSARGNGDPGWSGVEIGRLLVWLRILAAEQPRYRTRIDTLVGRWRLCRAIGPDGRLLAALPGSPASVETGTGYADYAAQGFRAWGLKVHDTANSSGEASIAVEGLDLPLPDSGQTEPLMTVPVALLGIEFNWVRPDGSPMIGAKRAAGLLLEAQKRRFGRTGRLTARSDFQRSNEPYHVNDTVMSEGFPWTTLDARGGAHADLALLSTGAAFAFQAIEPDSPYTRRLARAVDGLAREGGWPEGRYEAGGAVENTQSAATNAFLLEALLYREAGPLYPSRAAPVHGSTTSGEPYGCIAPIGAHPSKP